MKSVTRAAIFLSFAFNAPSAIAQTASEVQSYLENKCLGDWDAGRHVKTTGFSISYDNQLIISTYMGMSRSGATGSITNVDTIDPIDITEVKVGKNGDAIFGKCKSQSCTSSVGGRPATYTTRFMFPCDQDAERVVNAIKHLMELDGWVEDDDPFK